MAHVEDRLPPRFGEIREFMDFCLAEDPEFDNMEEIRGKWLKNKFPTEADLDGIKIFEKILDLKPNEEDDLEDRRFRVLTKLNQRLPYTWIQLHRMMAALCGWDGYELKLEDFILTVYLAMDSIPKLRAVIDLLAEVLPMHILIKIIQAVNWVNHVRMVSYTRSDVEVGIVPYQITAFDMDVKPLIGCTSEYLIEIEIKPTEVENAG